MTIEIVGPLTASIFCSALLSSVSLAQTAPQNVESRNGAILELNAARVGDRTGAELGVGYAFRSSRFELVPSVGAFIFPNEDDRFTSQTFNNGQTVCRDLSNGQFSDDVNCGPDVGAFGKIELNFLATDRFSLGVGGYVGDQSNAFGRLAYRFSDKVSIQGMGGGGYIAIGLRAGF
jgi:hypothetical protein